MKRLIGPAIFAAILAVAPLVASAQQNQPGGANGGGYGEQSTQPGGGNGGGYGVQSNQPGTGSSGGYGGQEKK